MKVVELISDSGGESEYIFKDGLNDSSGFYDGMILQGEKINNFLKLCLRSFVSAKIEANGFFVHFGWDFYVYIGTIFDFHEAIKTAQTLDLLIEKNVKSPYL